jgi:hypothetical protein
MKMIAEYMEKAVNFEWMAAEEKDAKLIAELEAQATAYKKNGEGAGRARRLAIAVILSAADSPAQPRYVAAVRTST